MGTHEQVVLRTGVSERRNCGGAAWTDRAREEARPPPSTVP